MRSILRMLLCVGVFIPLSVGLEAQQRNAGASSPAELDLAITYSAQRSNLAGGSGFWQQGGSMEVAATVYHGLGLAMNIAGTHASGISTSGVDLSTVTTTFGPRYTWLHPLHSGKQRRLDLFGQALIGEAHGLGGVFPSSTGAQSDADAFALQVGGGADLEASRHLAIRVLQADWLRTQLPNGGTNVQNSLRLGAGIVFRFPQQQ